MFGEESVGQRVEIAAPGPWVLAPSFVRDEHAPAESIDGGRRFWLSDTQIDLRGGEQAWFSRVVAEVVTTDGLQSIAQISIDFDPSYERLQLHHVRIIRAGETRELELRPLLNVLRRERDLERAMYDGRYTAHIVAPDVRIGDIVDYAYTLHGAHPSFRGRFSAEFGLQWTCWVRQTRIRLLADESRTLATKAWGELPAAETRALDDGGVERLWNAWDEPGARIEQDMPGWVRHRKSLRVADATTWADIASLFAPGYKLDASLPAELEDRAASLAEAFETPAARVVAALRLVQDGLRYHSVSLGDGGFVPRSLEHIWTVRAGDCKDSSRLLAALLRRLSVEADPALVNTVLGGALDSDLPGTTAFNHCIVRVRLDGRTYWLDPTRYTQGGVLQNLVQARYGWALPLVDDARLEAMGQDTPSPVCDVKERFELDPGPEGRGRLTLETRYRCWRADDMRRRLASEGPDALARSYREYYERVYGAVTETKPMEVEDDLEANVVLIRESYELGKPWEKLDEKRGRFGPMDDVFGPHLTTQRTAQRRYPIELGLPRSVSTETLIKLSKPIKIEPWDDVFEIPGVRASSKFEAADQTGTLFRLLRGLTVSKSEIPADGAEAFFDLRESALNASVLITDSKDASKPKARFSVGDFELDYRTIWIIVWLIIVVGGQLLAHLN